MVSVKLIKKKFGSTRTLLATECLDKLLEKKSLGQIRKYGKTLKITLTELHRSCLEMEKGSAQLPPVQLCTITRLYGRVDQWWILVRESLMKRLCRVSHSLGVFQVCFSKPSPVFHVSFLSQESSNGPLCHGSHSCSGGCQPETFSVSFHTEGDSRGAPILLCIHSVGSLQIPNGITGLTETELSIRAAERIISADLCSIQDQYVSRVRKQAWESRDTTWSHCWPLAGATGQCTPVNARTRTVSFHIPSPWWAPQSAETLSRPSCHMHIYLIST